MPNGTEPHRFPVLIDADPTSRASDAFYAEKRRAKWTGYLILMIALAALCIGATFLAMLAGKAAANVHVTILEVAQ